MSTEVDSPEIFFGQFVDSSGKLTPLAIRYLTGLWLRSGGTGDAVTNLEIGELYEQGVESGLVEEALKLAQMIDRELATLIPTDTSHLEKRLDNLEAYIESITLPDTYELQKRLDNLEASLEMPASTDEIRKRLDNIEALIETMPTVDLSNIQKQLDNIEAELSTHGY